MRGDNNKPSNLDEFFRLLFAGGVAGSCAKSSVAPLERVKIMYQTHHPEYPKGNPFKTIQLIYQREGINGLYRGNVSSIVRIFPYSAIQFTAFEEYKKAVRRTFKWDKEPLAFNILEGAAAGATAVLLTYPLDLVRARLAVQVHKAHYRGIAHAISTIYKTERGLVGLYKGINPSLWGILPYGGVNFFVFESCKQLWSSRHNSDPPTPIKLGFGALAGALGQTVTYPFDLVRRQMQVEGLHFHHHHPHHSHHATPTPGGLPLKDTQITAPTTVDFPPTEKPVHRSVLPRNTFKAIASIYHADGFKGLFRGLTINYLKVVPMVSVSFVTFDFMKRAVGVKRVKGASEK